MNWKRPGGDLTKAAWLLAKETLAKFEVKP